MIRPDKPCANDPATVADGSALADLRANLRLLKWTSATTLAGVLIILVKLFTT